MPEPLPLRPYLILIPSEQVVAYFKSCSSAHRRYFAEFETDVAGSPTAFPGDADKIRKIRDDAFPPESYRWKKDDLRILYQVNRALRTVWPYEANDFKNVSYR